MQKEPVLCRVCGEPLPPNEQMFYYHGYSGDCPKPPIKVFKSSAELIAELENKVKAQNAVIEAAKELRIYCLGTDASTMNMIERFDNALKRLDEGK